MNTRFLLAWAGVCLVFSASIAEASNIGFTFRGPASHMSEADWAMFRAEAREMLDSGKDDKTYHWANDDTGSSGSFTPNRSFEQDGLPCRLVTVTLAAGPAQGSQVMTVCRQPDDTWRIVR